MSEYALYGRDYAGAGPAIAGADLGPGVRPRGRPASNRRFASNRRGERGRRVAELAIRTTLVLACAAAAVALFVQFAFLPLTRLSRFELEGTTSLGLEEVVAWSGLSADARWHSTDAAALAASVASHPSVASCVARLSFPNRVTFLVQDRVPVAVVWARDGAGRMGAHLVDADGAVYAPASGRTVASELPVLSGVEIRGLRYGLRLDGPFPALLASLARLRHAEPALAGAISEMRMVVREGVPAELLLYTTNYRLPVRMPAVLDAGLLKSMMLVLDVVEERGLSPTIRELDLRTDTFVYRTKEAISG